MAKVELSMRSVSVAAVALALLGSAAGSAALAQGCVAPPQPLFEFQVDQPASYRGDTLLVPRPARERFIQMQAHPEAVIVQFVVDTLGAVDPRSFHVLRTPSAAAADSVRQVITRWAFTPAVSGGCRVPQLVQTAVTR